MYQSGICDLIAYRARESRVNLAELGRFHSYYWLSSKTCIAPRGGAFSIGRYQFCVPNNGDGSATAFGADVAVFAAAMGARKMGGRTRRRALKKASD